MRDRPLSLVTASVAAAALGLVAFVAVARGASFQPPVRRPSRGVRYSEVVTSPRGRARATRAAPSTAPPAPTRVSSASSSRSRATPNPPSPATATSSPSTRRRPCATPIFPGRRRRGPAPRRGGRGLRTRAPHARHGNRPRRVSSRMYHRRRRPGDHRAHVRRDAYPHAVVLARKVRLRASRPTARESPLGRRVATRSRGDQSHQGQLRRVHQPSSRPGRTPAAVPRKSLRRCVLLHPGRGRARGGLRRSRPRVLRIQG